MKRMYALGDDQMAEAEDRQQKERSNIVGRRVERDSEVLKWGGGVVSAARRDIFGRVIEV